MNTEKLSDSLVLIERIDLYSIKRLIKEQPDGEVKRALEFLEGMLYRDALPGVLAHQIVDMSSVEDEDTRQDLEFVLERALTHVPTEDLNNLLVGTEILEEDWDVPLPEQDLSQVSCYECWHQGTSKCPEPNGEKADGSACDSFHKEKPGD